MAGGVGGLGLAAAEALVPWACRGEKSRGFPRATNGDDFKEERQKMMMYSYDDLCICMMIDDL